MVARYMICVKINLEVLKSFLLLALYFLFWIKNYDKAMLKKSIGFNSLSTRSR
jgi:hypothetical protein